MPTVNTQGTLKTLMDGDELLLLQDVGGSPEDLKATIYQVSSHHFPALGSGMLLMPQCHVPGASTVATVAGTYYANPFRARPGSTFDRILFEVTTNQAVDGNYRFGMYAHDETTKKPTGAALYDSGTIAFTAAGLTASTTPYAVTISAMTVPASGLFWMVWQTDVAMTALRRGSAGQDRSMLPLASAAAVLSTGSANLGLSVAGSFGAMPSAPSFVLAASIPFIAIMKS